MIHLQTDRLIIRNHIREDLEDCLALFSDPAVLRYRPQRQLATIEDAEKQLQIEMDAFGKHNRRKYESVHLKILSARFCQIVNV